MVTNTRDGAGGGGGGDSGDGEWAIGPLWLYGSGARGVVITFMCDYVCSFN